MEPDRLEHDPRRRRPARRAALVLTGLVLTGALAACTQAPADDPTSAAPTPTLTASAPAVALQPDGTAEDNKPFFDQVNAATAQNAEAGGRDFVDALAAAGFDKAAMEVTKDATTLGDRAESIQFSVRWADGCLIGQFGPAVDGYHSTVQPVLGTDRCLIGETRTIDW